MDQEDHSIFLYRAGKVIRPLFYVIRIRTVTLPIKSHVFKPNIELTFQTDEVFLREESPWSPFIPGRGAREKEWCYGWKQEDNAFTNF